MTESNIKDFFVFLLPIGLGIFCLASLVGCKERGTTAQPGGDSSSHASLETAAAEGTDWKQFRGPDFTSVAFSNGFPTEWDESNVVWKSELVGRGASTPIIVGDRVFVTSYSGYGESAEKPGKLSELQHHLFCFDRITGKLAWQRDVQGSMANEEALNPNVLGHGFASSTPVTDGESVFAFFGTTGVFAFDVEGDFLWQTDVGWRHENFGSSASLVLHKNLLIVNASVESHAAYALDKTTGVGVWKIDDVIQSWSTPVLAAAPDGSLELLIFQQDIIRGFDPDTGAELWTCEGILDYVVPTPVVVDGVAYCNGGKEHRAFAVRLGGRGDVTKSHKLWEARIGAYVVSSVVHEGYVYLMKESGVFQVIDAKTGEVVNKERVKGAATVFGSPLLSGDKIYFPLPTGVLVVDAAPKYKKISLNKFASEKSEFKASLAVSGDRLLTRNDEFLYCIGSSKGKTRVNKLDSSKSEESKLIAAKPKYDYDEKVKKIRIYNRCFGYDSTSLEDFILAPYRSVITPEQTEKTRKLVQDGFGPFLEARAEQKEVYWKRIKQEISDAEVAQLLGEIEKKVMGLQRDLRTPVKKMFSSEQMEEHLAEHRAWLEKKKKK